MMQLDIRELSAGYGGKPVLHALNANAIAQDRVTALLGPNGSGKSTLLKTLAGLNPIQRGEVWLDGKNIAATTASQRAECAMYMPQALPKGVHMTVFESVLVAASAARGNGRHGNGRHGDGRHSKNILMENTLAVLTELGIAALAGSFLDELSGGQRQLASLAQALVRRPRLLLLDEPLSALDLNFQFHVMDVLQKQTRRHHLITVVVLHDLNIALRHADHALLLAAGQVVSEGQPQNVISPKTLHEVYGVRARVERCSQGQFQVQVDGLATKRDVEYAV